MCTINKSPHTKKVWKLIIGTAYIGLNILSLMLHTNKYFQHLSICVEYSFFSLKIINKNAHKNILEILDRMNIKVTFLYFSTNQKTQNKNILENPDMKLINKKYLGLKINK